MGPFSSLDSSAFRPDGERMGDRKTFARVASREDDRESGSGDEVPLNTIRVRKDLTWVESNRQGSAGHER